MRSLKESLTIWTISILRVHLVKTISRRYFPQDLTNNSPSNYMEVSILFQSKLEKSCCSRRRFTARIQSMSRLTH